MFICLFNLADEEIANAITQNTVNIAVINTYFDFNDYNTLVWKKDTCCKKDTPQKSNSHNIKLYDFYLKIIHFIKKNLINI